MTRTAPARRTNRALAAAVVLTVAVVVLAATFGSRGGSGAVTFPSTTVVSGTGRPEPGAISFSPATDDDVSYPMESLSCAAMATQVRLDLCGVFDGGAGRFMVAGAEAYWDPTEADLDGIVRVPLVLNVYVLGGSAGESVAAPVLGAIIAVPWGPSHDEVSLLEQPSPEGEIAVLVWTARETLRSEARERIAALAWSDDEPRVMASFEPGGSLRLLNAYAFPRTRGLVGS